MAFTGLPLNDWQVCVPSASSRSGFLGFPKLLEATHTLSIFKGSRRVSLNLSPLLPSHHSSLSLWSASYKNSVITLGSYEQSQKPHLKIFNHVFKVLYTFIMENYSSFYEEWFVGSHNPLGVPFTIISSKRTIKHHVNCLKRERPFLRKDKEG